MYNLVYFRKSIGELKSAGEITVMFPIYEWGGSEMAIRPHCDAVDILTKGGDKAQIGICGFIREKVSKENRDKSCLRGIAVAWASCGGIRLATSSYAWGNTSFFSRYRLCSFPKEYVRRVTFREPKYRCRNENSKR